MASKASAYELSTQLVRNWVGEYREMGLAGLEDRRGQRTAEQTPRTQMELDLLKKVKELERGDR